jgi:predicted Fe-Mo cluster-binding NifX family protein
MKIAISATGPDLDSEIDPRFGRSEYFIIVEPETMEFETLQNRNLEASAGAGIGAAQQVCDKGIGAVITGNIGPKALRVFSAAGVRMRTGASGRVRDAIEKFKSGKGWDELGSGVASGTPSGYGPGQGIGRIAGRGMGMGRGMGRQIGCGGGTGRGMGTGRSRAVAGKALPDLESELQPERGNEPGRPDDVGILKRKAMALAEELERIQQRIERMEKK